MGNQNLYGGSLGQNAKKILGFERFLSQIRDIEKNAS